MQSMTPQSADAASQLQIAANRVATVAQVHRNFYSNAAAYVSCLTFLHRLAADLSGIIGKPVDVRGDEGLVPTNLIQPIGLMASEMIANAAKHGKGRIALSYQMGGGLGVLQVCNDGDALPAGFDPNRPSGLGMRVITSLATQLRGRLEARPGANGSGACFTVTFPV
jgi:two-component sensor histidine kinase